MLFMKQKVLLLQRESTAFIQYNEEKML